MGLFLCLQRKSNSLLTRSKTKIMNKDKTYDCETSSQYHTRQKTKQFWYHVFSKIVQASVGTIPHGIKFNVMMTDNGRKHLVFKSRRQTLEIIFFYFTGKRSTFRPQQIQVSALVLVFDVYRHVDDASHFKTFSFSKVRITFAQMEKVF